MPVCVCVYECEHTLMCAYLCTGAMGVSVPQAAPQDSLEAPSLTLTGVPRHHPQAYVHPSLQAHRRPFVPSPFQSEGGPSSVTGLVWRVSLP